MKLICRSDWTYNLPSRGSWTKSPGLQARVKTKNLAFWFYEEACALQLGVYVDNKPKSDWIE